MIDLYVINLEKRIDRWKNIIKNFSDLEFNLIRVDAVSEKKGWHGCFKSHQKCIQIAKDNNLKNIMVIEDDCIPFDILTFKDRLIKIKKYLNEHDDWNIFLGGTASLINKSYNKCIKFCENEFFVEFTKAYMTHMICYNSNCYDFYLNYFPLLKPIDEFWFNKLVALVPVPFLAKQLPGFSNIMLKNKNDENRTNDANKKLLQYINS